MAAASNSHRNAAKLSLVADIGGTRARFALVDESGLPGPAVELAVADFATPLAAIESFLATVGEPHLAAAVFAIAAPVQGDVVRLTNASWTFDRAELKAALGLAELQLINDFTGLALVLPVLAADELRQVGGGAPVDGAPKALLGPGTGLGVSGLLRHGSDWLPLAGEGGHVTLAASDEREAEIIALARREHGHVSAERLVSGSGLPFLHRLVCAVDGLDGRVAAIVAAAPGAADPHAPALDAAAIVAAAHVGDPAGLATVDTFCAFLGTLASDLVLTLGAQGGLYLGGGILPRLGGLFDASPFRARFEAKGRYRTFLAGVPAYVILAPSPALRGAARLLPPTPKPQKSPRMRPGT